MNYQHGQEAYLLFTGTYYNYFANDISPDHCLITISPDSFTVAIAIGKSFVMINTQTREMSDVLQDVHGGEIILRNFAHLYIPSVVYFLHGCFFALSYHISDSK